MAQVAEIDRQKARMRADVRYFLEVCGMKQPSDHPGVLALLEVLAERKQAVPVHPRTRKILPMPAPQGMEAGMLVPDDYDG